MTFQPTRLIALLLASFTLACGGDDGKSDASSESSAGETTASTGTSAGATDTGTGDTPTTGSSGGASDSASGTSTGDTPTGTGDASTTAVDPGTSSGGSTGDASTGEVTDFERFRIDNAAGLCPPDVDCDGFTELLGTRLLRVSPFGEVGDPVTEVEISAEDFTAAVQVFAAPELLALLDGPDPLCNAPSDVFETMLVEVGGSSHDADTVFCDQAPLGAARDMADMLAMKYAP